jgi:hypothetical protein
MFKWLEEMSAKRQAQRLLQVPLIQAAVAKSEEVVSETDLPQLVRSDTLARLREELLTEVVKIHEAQDKVGLCRELLADAVLKRAKLEVLVQDATAEDVTGLRALGFVSGKLKPLVREIVEADTDLRQWMYGVAAQVDEETAWNAVLTRYWIDAWRAEVFNACRVALKDNNALPGRDWYRPFLHAMCAWEEDNYRRLLELPSLLPNNADGIEALKYSTFLNFVLDGERYPDLSFNDHYTETDLERVAEKMREP